MYYGTGKWLPIMLCNKLPLVSPLWDRQHTKHNGQQQACSIALTSVVNDYDISSTLEDYEQDEEH
jgi:hypothetical protein